MEVFPNSEQSERRKWLVDNLKERGADDPQAKETLRAWFKHQESLRGPEPGSEIKDMIEYAELCKDAGLKDQAREVLDDALRNAWQGFGDAELCDRIEDIIDSL